jgi:uncharacterized protein YndB with AHSA1/START domain
VNAPLEKVWTYWNNPEHITKWAFASDDWEAPHAENDLQNNGRFLIRMSAKDKSISFDFGGTYTNIIPNKLIEYSMNNDPAEKSTRKVSTVFFSSTRETTKITEIV